METKKLSLITDLMDDIGRIHEKYNGFDPDLNDSLQGLLDSLTPQEKEEFLKEEANKDFFDEFDFNL